MNLQHFPAALSILVLSILGACSIEKENPPRPVSLREFSEKFPVTVCKGSSVQTSNEISPTLKARWSVYIIEFDNTPCLHDFYDQIRSASEISDNFDERKYYRSQGVLTTGRTSYFINRLEDSKIAFVVQK